MVGEPTGPELPQPPDRRVHGGDSADLPAARTRGGEVEGHEAPGERVVQVVDEPCLRACAQDGVAVADEWERLAQRDLVRAAAVHGLLGCDVGSCVPNEERRDGQAGDRDHGTAHPDDGTRRDRRRERARQERCGGDAQVAGRLVEAECEPTASRPDEVDLHHHGHRPGKTLADAEKQVRDDDDAPVRRDPDQDGHGEREEPAEHEQALSSGAVGERSRREVGQRLRGAERDDEGEDRGLRLEPEVLLPDQRQHGPLHSDHGADERVDPDEECELRRVLPQTELDGGHAGGVEGPRRFAATIAS